MGHLELLGAVNRPVTCPEKTSLDHTLQDPLKITKGVDHQLITVVSSSGMHLWSGVSSFTRYTSFLPLLFHVIALLNKLAAGMSLSGFVRSQD